MPTVPTFKHRYFFRVAAAVLGVFSAFVITTQIEAISARTPFAFFYASVAFATWIGGRPIGFGALILSAAAGGYFILSPDASAIRDLSGVLQLSTFVTVGLIFVFLTSRLRIGATMMRESEGRYRTLFEYSPYGILIADRDSNYIDANEKMCGLLGYRHDELVGMHASDIVAPLEAPEIDAALKTIKSGDDRARDWKFRRKDGSRFLGEVVATQMPDGTLLGLVRDVTERERAEENVRRSQERLKAVVETALDGIIMMDHEGRIIRFNPAAEQIFSYRGRDVIGENLADKIIPPSLREAHRRGLERLLAGHPPAVLGKRLELKAIRADGTEFPVELTISRLGSEEPPLFTGFVRDITDRKRAEESLLRGQEELERRVAERTAELELANKELEAFSYSVSHDLRAPLRHIDGFVKLLANREGERLDETSRRYIGVVSAAVAKMGMLIDELLAFSRTGRREIHAGPVDLDNVVKETMQILEQAERTVRWSIKSLPVVDGDTTLLGVVFTNLLSNALKFTRDREIAEIEVGSLEEANGNVKIYVKDNGVGFDMAYSKKLFGVFQRLHRDDEFEGIGIGLATVQRIINRHGGRIWAEAETGKGATFYMVLKKAGGITEGGNGLKASRPISDESAADRSGEE